MNPSANAMSPGTGLRGPALNLFACVRVTTCVHVWQCSHMYFEGNGLFMPKGAINSAATKGKVSKGQGQDRRYIHDQLSFGRANLPSVTPRALAWRLRQTRSLRPEERRPCSNIANAIGAGMQPQVTADPQKSAALYARSR